MTNPFNFSQQNAAHGHQQNVEAGHRAMRNHQASQAGGGGGGAGGLLVVVFLILVVILVAGAL